jgi:glycosyltransferase involved in cell wall biosynthesis
VADIPTIAIVTPSFQHGRFLEWTLRSVLLQGYPKLEYVVMDGGSTDETPEILARYAGRLSHVESAKDGGQADAVARGFARTQGEIMAYLNSDDVLAPGALKFVAQFFADNPGVDAVYSHRVFMREDGVVASYWLLPAHSNALMKRWDYIPQETCFWRRRIYDAAGGIDPAFQFALDYDLFVRFMERGRMQRVNRFLGAFRRHAAAKTATLKEGRVHPEIERVRKQHRIWMPRGHGLAELALSKWVARRSFGFASSGSVLPGALAGVGYSYDRVWEGKLSGARRDSLP